MVKAEESATLCGLKKRESRRIKAEGLSNRNPQGDAKANRK